MKFLEVGAIHIENLSKCFVEKEVLKGVSLKIAEGEFYALMGHNGSGKTTLASIIASIRKPPRRSRNIRPASPVNVFGKVIGDAKVFKQVTSGTEVIIERVS